MPKMPSKERQAAKSLLQKMIAMMRAESDKIKPTAEQMLIGTAAVIVLRRDGFEFTDQQIKNIVSGDRQYVSYKGFDSLDAVLYGIGSHCEIDEVFLDLLKTRSQPA